MLGIMLISGAIGSLAPVYIGLGHASSLLISLWLSSLGILSIFLAVAFVSLWSLIPTLTLMTLFYLIWHFVTVVFYTQLALALDYARDQEMLRVIRRELILEGRLKKSYGSSVPCLYGGGQESGGSFRSEEVLNAVHKDGVVTDDGSRGNGRLEEDRNLKYSHSCSNEEKGVGSECNIASIDVIYNSNPTSTSTSASVHTKNRLPTPALTQPLFSQTHDAPLEESAAASPYSLAVMIVVSINVSLQIVFQAVLFTTMEMTVRAACGLLVAIYCVLTISYCFFALGGAGWRTLWRWKSILKLSRQRGEEILLGGMTLSH